VFGGLLFFTAVRMLFTRHDAVHPDKNILVRAVRKLYPVTSDLHGGHFFIRKDGKYWATPLFIALLVVESADLLFAVDSIPAIIALTRDSFIVFTSNVFAILGLRSLYFALAAVIDRFRYLKVSLVFVLAYIGVKMILSHHVQIPIVFSLSVIAGFLIAGILASIVAREKHAVKSVSPAVAEPADQNPQVGVGKEKAEDDAASDEIRDDG